MKKIKLIVSTILIVSVLFGLVGCKKKFDEVTSEEFVNALEEVVGLSEEDIRVVNYDSSISEYRIIYADLIDIQYEVEICHDQHPSIYAERYCFDEYHDADYAREIFEINYESRENSNNSNGESYLGENYGYILHEIDGANFYHGYSNEALEELNSRYNMDELVLYGGMYYYDTTLISIECLSDNEEDIERTRDFLDALGLPHM